MNIRLHLAAVDAWAMHQDHLDRIMAAVAAVEDPMPADTDGEAFAVTTSNNVATISVSGMLLKSGAADARMWGMDATGYDEIGAALAEAEDDDSVSNIVLAIDSPGGQVSGCQALADQIAACSKPVQAHVQDLCASGAYWLASQCKDITANRTALVGSIGVYNVIRDVSRAAENAGIKTHVISSGGVKGAGVPGAPITDPQLAEIQKRTDAQCAQFCAAIASGRGKSATDIRALADGRVHLAAEAKGLGLIDHVSNTPQVLPPMNIAPARMAALIKEHPARASFIADLCAADKSEADIMAAIKEAQGIELADKSKALAEAHAKLGKDFEAEKVAAAKAVADLKAAHAAELAEKDKALAAVQAKHDAMAALAKNGVKDPGEQNGTGTNAEIPAFTAAQASAGQIPQALVESGKYRIDG